MSAAALVVVVDLGRAVRVNQNFCRFQPNNARFYARIIVFGQCILHQGRLLILCKPLEYFASMTIPVQSSVCRTLSFNWRACAPITLISLALCGCSINIGSWSPDPDQEAPKAAPAETGVNEAQTKTAQGQTLLRSGKTKEALAEFDQALALDPHNAQALYIRGMVYQGNKQHQLAINDFTAANGLTPQRVEPLLGRAVSYLALDKAREAAADLDEAVQTDPQNAQIWTTRGLAYERLGDKAKAADCYSHALGIRPKDEAARSGLARVGNKPG